MSKSQIKTVVLTTLRLTGTIALFAAKAIVYLCIAIAVVGQLLFAEYTQSAPVAVEQSEPAPIADEWEDVAPTPLPRDGVVCPVEPLPVVTCAKEIDRPAVLVVDIPDAQKESIAIAIDATRYQSMTSPQLRQECSAIGIKWRNAHGTSKHLSKAEMLTALTA